MSNQELATDLHKSIIRKFEKPKYTHFFSRQYQCADLADMQLISKFNKGISSLLCVIDILSKYGWVILLKDKKGITVTNASQTILDNSNRKPNKIWVVKGSKFYNRAMKSWLQDNDIEICSAKQKEICCCRQIYQNFKEQNLEVCGFNIKKYAY